MPVSRRSLITKLPQFRDPNQLKPIEEYVEQLQKWLETQNTDLEQSPVRLMQAVADLYAKLRPTTLVPILPLLLRLNGKPYTLQDHFMMEPIFRTVMPQSLLLKCGRQVTKTTSLAAQGVMQTAVIPHFKTLFLTPLYEMVRRFSTNYVKPFIELSPLRSILRSTSVRNAQSVLQRSFANESIMFFSFAFLDVTRVRGISCDKIAIDEVQDMDMDFLPIILQCASHSSWEIHQYSGTPKTYDNTIQALWEDSSQAEWVIKCTHCSRSNIPAVEYDAEKMIGKHGVICAHCGKPIDPRTGRWVHAYPDRVFKFAGYHVPQIILPLHYANPEKWADIVTARERGPMYSFYNEILGESCDVGTKLVSLEDIRAASEDRPNTVEFARRRTRTKGVYDAVAIGIDWGGGGVRSVGDRRSKSAETAFLRGEMSYTCIAVGGLRGTRIDILYGERLSTLSDPFAEAKRVKDLYSEFQPDLLAHDYTGAGNIRETMAIQAGVPAGKIMPILYTRLVGKDMIVYRPATASSYRAYWSADKSRTLVLLCQAIKAGMVKFPSYESSSHLTEDFLALVEDKIPVPGSGDIYRVTKNPNRSDDFANAVNYMALALWRISGLPNFEEAVSKMIVTEHEVNLAHPGPFRSVYDFEAGLTPCVSSVDSDRPNVSDRTAKSRSSKTIALFRR